MSEVFCAHLVSTAAWFPGAGAMRGKIHASMVRAEVSRRLAGLPADAKPVLPSNWKAWPTWPAAKVAPPCRVRLSFALPVHQFTMLAGGLTQAPPVRGGAG